MSYSKENLDRFGDESLSNFIGIDLGTTYSVVAYINADGKPDLVVANRSSGTVSVLLNNTPKPFQDIIN